MGHLKYVLITAARNEEAFIENTIRSVVAQNELPEKWVIVSDGSTDRTDDIIKQYAVRHGWIELLRMPEHQDRQFAAKAHCINAAYARLQNAAFDVVGNLDADITFDGDYFQFVLEKFAAHPRLGVAGTPYIEDDHKQNEHSCTREHADLSHVSGPCQMFRRECFEAVGGYVPIKGGAIDWVAVTTARMMGWETRTFIGKSYFHHRKMGTAACGLLISRFRYGRKAYSTGGHPVWEFLRGIFQMRKRPFFLGGVYFICGFFWALLTGMERPVSRELMAFHRAEQMARLRSILRREPSPSKVSSPVAPRA
jgi:glycosyltransferase involved in cell wall biosynthesis